MQNDKYYKDILFLHNIFYVDYSTEVQVLYYEAFQEYREYLKKYIGCKVYSDVFGLYRDWIIKDIFVPIDPTIVGSTHIVLYSTELDGIFNVSIVNWHRIEILEYNND